ncbi:MAG: class I SAM-dependent methyltransferase [Alphaproteobacteria bacterium]|nr:class I SAM-dependent methyltransferase [Alphaproteobacteria bacterium]
MTEQPHASACDIIALYERHAEAWDRLRGPTDDQPFEAPWLDRFLATLPAHPTLLDLGCGSGAPVTRYLVEAGASVTGVDSSPTLIAKSRARFTGGDWIVADMRGLDLGRRFDGLLAWNSFFHLAGDDQRAMFAVFAAHVRPGGSLMFTSGPEHGEAIGEFEGEALYHASLSAEEYRSLLARAGFDVLEHVVRDATCGGATVWLARREPFHSPH